MVNDRFMTITKRYHLYACAKK